MSSAFKLEQNISIGIGGDKRFEISSKIYSKQLKINGHNSEKE